MTVTTPSIEEITRVRELLADVVPVTPVTACAPLSARVGGPVWLKCENLQRAGSFKIRGAYTRMSRLSQAEKDRGVVAASAGNHAQGVALAGQILGIAVTVYMPYGAPLPKIEATKGYGAKVILHGSTIDDCLKQARLHEAETGAVLIHPFDHPDIVCGQATVGLEILEQVPDVKTIIVPTGGGGLIAGISAVMAQVRPQVTVVGVQAKNAAAYPMSLAAGSPQALTSMTTMADGIAVGCPGQVPFDVIRQCVQEIRTVTEDQLATGLLMMLESSKLLVEPAGAAAAAAVLAKPEDFQTPAVVVLSGGNIDPLLLLRLIRHAMSAAGRYQELTVRAPDKPGTLAGVLQVLAQGDANVMEVSHRRTRPTLPADQVEMIVLVETTGVEHTERLLAALRDKGFEVDLGLPTR